MEEKGKEFLKFHHKRKTINLCKSFLFLLEDLKGEALTEEKYQKVRKRVLDGGNDSIREFDDHLENFNVNIR
tara:strand:+ start:400 stop:615 length:216 start_codon:yes stop_codon:yes gene_type:complete